MIDDVTAYRVHMFEEHISGNVIKTCATFESF